MLPLALILSAVPAHSDEPIRVELVVEDAPAAQVVAVEALRDPERLLEELPDPPPTAAPPSSAPPPTRAAAPPTLPALPPTWPPLAPARARALTVDLVAPSRHTPTLLATFDQPMPAGQPVTLDPELDGTWRWVGSRRLLFEPDGPWPPATSFTATVSMDTHSAAGAALPQTAGLAFRTAPATVLAGWGRPDAAPGHLRLHFHRPFDPADVARRVHLAGPGGPHTLQLDPTSNAHLVVLSPPQPLPLNRRFRVVFDADAGFVPYGGRPFAFRTPRPQRWDERCGRWLRWPCTPDRGIDARLRNDLDPSTVRVDEVVVSPAPPDLSVGLSGRSLRVDGTWAIGSAVRVTLPDGLRDVYGQPLRGGSTRRFRIRHLRQPLPRSASPGLTALEPGWGAGLPLYGDARAVRMTVRQAEAEDLTSRHRGDLDGPGIRARLRSVDDPRHPRLRAVSLDGWLDAEGHGQLLVEVWRRGARFDSLRHWVQATELGLSAHVDDRQVLAVVTDLASGAPRANVEVSLGGPGVRTDEAGVAVLARPDADTRVLRARAGGDLALLVLPELEDPPPELRWLAFSDRPAVQPGERFGVAGWVRSFPAGPAGGVQTAALDRATWVLRDPTGQTRDRGELALSPLGGFSLEGTLPPDAVPGPWTVELGPGAHPQILQVPPPGGAGLEVALEADVPLLVAGASTRVRARARPTGGIPVGSAGFQWALFAEPGATDPPGWEGWRFGRALDPMRDRYDTGRHAELDPTGAATLRLDLEELTTPLVLRIEAWGNARWSARTSLVAWPAAVLPGVRPESHVHAGAPVAVDLVAVDPDGRAVAGRPLEATLSRAETTLSCSRVSGSDPVTCSFPADESGVWQLRVEITDTSGQRAVTEVPVRVAGRAPEPLALVGPAEPVRPGEEVQLAVHTPFVPAWGVLVSRRDGIAEHRRIHLTEPTSRLSVTAGPAPRLDLDLELFGQDPDGAPAHARAGLQLDVLSSAHALDVEVRPRLDELRPGADATVEIEVRDATGAPVTGAEVVVFAVDARAPGSGALPDPLAWLHGARPARVWQRSLYDQLVRWPAPTDRPRGVRELSARSPPRVHSAHTSSSYGSAQPLHVREDFQPLALFRVVTTGSAGTAQVSFSAPDSIAEVRIAAVAVGPHQRAGVGEARLRVVQPLELTPLAPSYLHAGDLLALPLQVRNDLAAPARFELALRAEPSDGPDVGVAVDLEPGQLARPTLPLAAGEPGTLRLRAVLAAGAERDAVALRVPVRAPVALRTDAVEGTLRGGVVAWTLAPPEDAARGELSLTASTDEGLLEPLRAAALTGWERTHPEGLRALQLLALLDLRDGGVGPELARWRQTAIGRLQDAARDGWAWELVLGARALQRAGHPPSARHRARLKRWARQDPDGTALSWLIRTLQPRGMRRDARLRAELEQHLRAIPPGDDVSTAAALTALLAVDPDHPAVDGLARTLLRDPPALLDEPGPSTVCALDALADFAARADPRAPTAHVWLGPRYLGTLPGRIAVPLHQVEPGPLVVAAEGAGPLHWRLSLAHAPLLRPAEPVERGLAVARSFEGVDDPSDVSRDEDGTWHIRAGARVSMRVDTAIDPAQAGRPLGITAPLPAGLALAPPRYGLPSGQELDDGLVVEEVRIAAGVHTTRLPLRARTVGTFHVGPATAAVRHVPEVFGHSAADIVRVEPRLPELGPRDE